MKGLSDHNGRLITVGDFVRRARRGSDVIPVGRRSQLRVARVKAIGCDQLAGLVQVAGSAWESPSNYEKVGDFTAHRNPSFAVACPDCGARVGASCARPSGHRAMTVHKRRAAEADRVWLELKLPGITQVGPEKFIYEGTHEDALARQAGATTGRNEEAIMKTKAKKKAGARKGRTGKTVSTRKSPAARKGPGGGESKTAQLETLLANPTTLKAVCAKFGWLEHSARAAISTLPGKIAKARPGVKAEVLKGKNAAGDATYQLALKGSAKAAA